MPRWPQEAQEIPPHPFLQAEVARMVYMGDDEHALGDSRSIFKNTSTDSVSLRMCSQEVSFLEKKGGMQVVSGRSVNVNPPSTGYWRLKGAILPSSSKERFDV
eukprot:1974492-Amphidinium_carterae.1